MYKLLLILAMTFIITPCFSQDTLVTKYPASEKKWEKVFQGETKTSETIFFENGSTWMTAKYGPGKSANWNWFSTMANPYFQALIIEDKLEGIYRIWYENGQLAEQLQFRNNLENGEAIYYYTNGQVAMKGQYLNGKMVGNWSFFDEAGKPYNGMWQWPFAASPEKNRVEGKVQAQNRVGDWTYRTTAGTRSGPLKNFRESLD